VSKPWRADGPTTPSRSSPVEVRMRTNLRVCWTVWDGGGGLRGLRAAAGAGAAMERLDPGAAYPSPAFFRGMTQTQWPPRRDITDACVQVDTKIDRQPPPLYGGRRIPGASRRGAERRGLIREDAQLRKMYLDYFVERGHLLVPSSSLVPYKDSSYCSPPQVCSSSSPTSWVWPSP